MLRVNSQHVLNKKTYDMLCHLLVIFQIGADKSHQLGQPAVLPTSVTSEHTVDGDIINDCKISVAISHDSVSTTGTYLRTPCHIPKSVCASEALSSSAVELNSVFSRGAQMLSAGSTHINGNLLNVSSFQPEQQNVPICGALHSANSTFGNIDVKTVLMTSDQICSTEPSGLPASVQLILPISGGSCRTLESVQVTTGTVLTTTSTPVIAHLLQHSSAISRQKIPNVLTLSSKLFC